MVESYGSINTGMDTSLDSGFSDFTEEEKKRFEVLGYDVAKMESALRDGSETKEDLLELADWKDSQQAESVSREVERKEAGMPDPQNRYLPATVDYQDVPQQQKGFSWDNFFSTNTGPIDATVGALSDTSEFLGTVAGFGVEALGRATNNEMLYKAGKFIKEQSVTKARSFKDWGMDEEAKADALGPRSVFTYDKPDDWMPSGMGNFNIGTISQLFGSALATGGGLLVPAKLIAKKLIKSGMSPSKAGYLGMGLSAGGAEGTMIASEAYDNAIEFARNNPEGVKQSPIYNEVRQAVLSRFPDATEEDLFTFITDEIAESAAISAGVPSGAVIGLTSMPMAGFLNRMGFWGKGAKKFDGVKKPWGEVIYGGAWREGAEEGFQEGWSQLWSNYAEYKSGKSPDAVSGKGVAEAIAAGTVGGTTAGPVFGGYANIGRMPQEELDTKRTFLMHGWSQTQKGEGIDVKSFTTPGNENFIGGDLESLGLEFEQGDTFETVASKNKIDVKAIEKIQAALDEREKLLPTGEDVFADKVEGEEKPEEKKVATPKTQKDKDADVLMVLDSMDLLVFGDDNKLGDTWDSYIALVSALPGSEGKDASKIAHELRVLGVSGTTNANKELKEGFFESVVRATAAKRKAKGLPDLKLEERYSKRFKGKADQQTEMFDDETKKPDVSGYTVGEEDPERLRLSKVEREAKKAYQEARKRRDEFYERNPDADEFLEETDERGVKVIRGPAKFQEEYNKVLEDEEASNKAYKAAEKATTEYVLSKKKKPTGATTKETPTAKRLSEVERKKIAKDINLRTKTHVKGAEKKLKEAQAGLKKSEESKATVKKKADAKVRFNADIKKYKDRIKKYKASNKADQKKLDDDAAIPITAKKPEEKKPEEKVATPKIVSEALSLIQNFPTEEKLNSGLGSKAANQPELQRILKGLGVAKARKETRPETVKKLFGWWSKYKKAVPSATESVVQSGFQKLLASISGKGTLSIREKLTASDENKLVDEETFQKLKTAYLAEIDRLRSKKVQTKEDKAFISKWETALLDVSGKAGLVKEIIVNPITGKEEIEYKVVWYGSDVHVKMKRRDKSWSLKQIRTVTHVQYDFPRLFEMATHKDPKVRELAELLLVYETPNQIYLDALFPVIKDGKIVESVFGGHNTLASPSRFTTQEDVNIMYTRINNGIDSLLSRRRNLFVFPAKGAGEAVKHYLTLEQVHELGNLATHAEILRTKHDAKLVPYKKLATDEYYIRNFRKATKMLVGDNTKGGGFVTKPKKRLREFMNSKIKELEKFKSEQYGKARSKTDKRTLKEAEKYISEEDGRIAKAVEAEMNKELPLIIKAYERYYDSLREDGFDVSNLKPNLWEDFTTEELKDESNKIKQARRNMTEKINAMHEGTIFVGRSGVFGKTGWAATTEERDIYAKLIQQHISGEGDEILTPQDYVVINDHYKMINETGYESSMNLERLRNLGYRPGDYNPERDWMGGGWNTILRKKPLYQLFTDRDGNPVYDYKDIAEITTDEQERIILMGMQKAGYPLRKYEIKKEAIGVKTDDNNRPILKGGKTQTIYREYRQAVAQKDANGKPMYEMQHARVHVSETISVPMKVRKVDPKTGKYMTRKVQGIPHPNFLGDIIHAVEDVYETKTVQVFTGKADPNAPLDYERKYRIRHTTGTDKGKEELVLLKDLPKDEYVMDVYLEETDRIKIDAIFADESLTKGEQQVKIDRLLSRREELGYKISKKGKGITKGKGGEKRQVYDPIESKKRGYAAYKEVDTGVWVPYNAYRPTYEKITTKVSIKNVKGEDVVDARGQKMYREEWQSEIVIENGVQKPRMEFVWEEVEEFTGESEHPFLEIKDLPPEEKAIQMRKHGNKILETSGTGWGVIHHENGKREGVIGKVTGVPEHILNKMYPKKEMTDTEIDAYVQSFYKKATSKRKKNEIASRDYYNRIRTGKILHAIDYGDGEERTDFDDNTLVKDVVNKRDSNGKLLQSFVWDTDEDGSRVLKKISPSLAATMDAGVTRHPQTGLRYPTYQPHVLGSKNYPGDLVWRDDPKKHISLEVITTENTKEIRVIAEDGTMEGDLVGIVVLVRNEDGYEQISMTHFDTAAVANARMTVEEVDKLIGHSLGVYVADQAQHYTGVDPFATQWGVRKNMIPKRRGEEGYEDYTKPVREIIKEMESKAPPVLQKGDAPINKFNDANRPFNDKERPHIFNRGSGGMTVSTKEAFNQAMYATSQFNSGYNMSVHSRINPKTGKFYTLAENINFKTGEAYEVGGRWFTGDMGMDEIKLPSESDIAKEALAIDKRHGFLLGKLVKKTKTKEKEIDVTVIGEEDKEKIQKLQEQVALGTAEIDPETGGAEPLTKEQQELLTEGEKQEQAETKKEQLARIKSVTDSAEAWMQKMQAKSKEYIEAGDKATEQQRVAHELFQAASKIAQDENFYDNLATLISGISMKEGGVKDDVSLGSVDEDNTGDGIGSEIDDTKNRGTVCGGVG